jgi:hypothetical protein
VHTEESIACSSAETTNLTVVMHASRTRDTYTSYLLYFRVGVIISKNPRRTLGVPMRSFSIAPLQAAVVFSLGVIIGSGMLGGFTKPTQPLADSVITGSVQGSCASGDVVADFVCRNSWVANTRYSHR